MITKFLMAVKYVNLSKEEFGAALLEHQYWCSVTAKRTICGGAWSWPFTSTWCRVKSTWNYTLTTS